MGSGQVSANITHVFACPKFCCTGPVVEPFIHAHVSILLRTWSLPTWLAHRASALPPCLCVAAKPQGDPQVPSCGWISRHLRQHQGPAAPSCLCSLLAGQWAPYLARLDNSGSINAWSTDRSNAWIQVRGALCLEAPLGALQGHAGAEGLMDGQCFPSHICCFPLPSERGALRS